MPVPNWKRLGEQLVRRRIELDPRYSNRKTFAAERGVGYRIVTDIEHGRRGNYEPATLAAVEVAYGITPGSTGRALAGGELEPLPAPRLASVPPPPSGDETDAEAAYTGLLMRADPRDIELLQLIGRSLDADGRPYPWRRRLAIAQEYLRLRDESNSRPDAGTALPAAAPALAFR